MVAIKNVCEGTEAQMHPDAPQGKDAQKRTRAKDTCGRGKVEKLGKTDGLCELTSKPALHGEIESRESGNEATPSLRPRRRGLRADVSQQREKAIDQLVADAAERGDCVDRFYWMLVYDLEMAPMTSNLKQLTDLGWRFHRLTILMSANCMRNCGKWWSRLATWAYFYCTRMG